MERFQIKAANFASYQICSSLWRLEIFWLKFNYKIEQSLRKCFFLLLKQNMVSRIMSGDIWENKIKFGSHLSWKYFPITYSFGWCFDFLSVMRIVFLFTFYVLIFHQNDIVETFFLLELSLQVNILSWLVFFICPENCGSCLLFCRLVFHQNDIINTF